MNKFLTECLLSSIQNIYWTTNPESFSSMRSLIVMRKVFVNRNHLEQNCNQHLVVNVRCCFVFISDNCESSSDINNNWVILQPHWLPILHCTCCNHIDYQYYTVHVATTLITNITLYMLQPHWLPILHCTCCNHIDYQYYTVHVATTLITNITLYMLQPHWLPILHCTCCNHIDYQYYTVHVATTLITNITLYILQPHWLPILHCTCCKFLLGQWP